MRATCMALLAVLSVVEVASAQTAQPIPRGTRVRVTPATPSPRVVGELIAVNDSALLVRRKRGSGDITIPRSVVLRLEVSQGTSRGMSGLQGALLGSVIGGVVGYYRGNDHCHDSWFCLNRPSAAVLGGFTGAAGGSLIGLMVGSFERWRDTAVPMSLAVIPTGGQSLSVAGRIAF